MGERTTTRNEHVALFARFRPQQPFCVLGPELNPLASVARYSRHSDALRQLPVDWFGLMNRRWIRSDVFLELFRKEDMYHFRLVMWNLEAAEARVEL
jgi:hypothetical protein